MSAKNETQEYLREKIDEIANIISFEQVNNKTEWARANFDYGRLTVLLAEIEKNNFSHQLYEDAIQAFENSLHYYQTDDDISNYFSTVMALSQTWRGYALHKGDELGKAYLNKASKLLKKAIAKIKQQNLYAQEIMLICEQASLMRYFTQLSTMDTHEAYLKKALNLYDQALNILQIKEEYTNWSHISLLKGAIYNELSALPVVKNKDKYLKKAVALFTSIVQATALDNELSEEHSIANLELGFLYSNLAKKDKNIIYINKALLAFKCFLNNKNLKISKQIILKIELEKAQLLYNFAITQKNSKTRISGLKKAINLYNDNIKKLQKNNNFKELQKCYQTLAEIYKFLAFQTAIVKEKLKYLNFALSFYEKQKNNEAKDFIFLYKQLAKYEEKLAISCISSNQKLMVKSYKKAIIYLNKAIKVPAQNNIALYLKIIRILRDLSIHKKPTKIYYQLALSCLNKTKNAYRFRLQHNALSEDINKIYKQNSFKYVINKLLGINL